MEGCINEVNISSNESKVSLFKFRTCSGSEILLSAPESQQQSSLIVLVLLLVSHPPKSPALVLDLLAGASLGVAEVALLLLELEVGTLTRLLVEALIPPSVLVLAPVPMLMGLLAGP